MAEPLQAQPSAEVLRGYCLGEVFAYLSRRLPRREDAEDVAVEVFTAAYGAGRRAPDGELRAWLFGIARRKVADFMRKRNRRKEALEADLGHAVHVADPDDPNKRYLRREALDTLRGIVEGLPQEQREALLMQHLEDLSILEIALVLEKTPAAINSLLQRARATIFNKGKIYFSETQEVLS